MPATKLSDIQLILLTTAIQREDGSLLPPPESLGDQSARIRKAIPPLVKRALVKEVTVTDATRVWREEGDARIGLAITAAGRAIIAVEEPSGEPGTLTASPLATPAKPSSKISNVTALLQRNGGATLAELVDATGWLPHTTRAALTGLRKKGHAIEKAKRGDATAYLITAAA